MRVAARFAQCATGYVVTTVLLAAAGPRSACGDVGEIGLSLGAMDPQGDFSDFAETGFHVKAHVSLHAPAARVFALHVDGNFTWFSSSESAGQFEFSDGEPFIGIQSVDQTAYSLHVGPQLGSPTTHGVLRPRLGAGIGAYLFVIDTNVRPPDFEQGFDYETTYLGRFGWRANLGLDVFLGDSWGIAIDALYDQVWNLNLQTASGETVEHPQYFGATLGVVFAFDVTE